MKYMFEIPRYLQSLIICVGLRTLRSRTNHSTALIAFGDGAVRRFC